VKVRQLLPLVTQMELLLAHTMGGMARVMHAVSVLEYPTYVMENLLA
jgi:hypothetical protein